MCQWNESMLTFINKAMVIIIGHTWENVQIHCRLKIKKFKPNVFGLPRKRIHIYFVYMHNEETVEAAKNFSKGHEWRKCICTLRSPNLQLGRNGFRAIPLPYCSSNYKHKHLEFTWHLLGHSDSNLVPCLEEGKMEFCGKRMVIQKLIHRVCVKWPSGCKCRFGSLI